MDQLIEILLIGWGMSCASFTVLSRTVLRSLFCLVLTYALCAVHLLYAGAELLAIYYLIIYVGAVLVIFLFAVMITGVARHRMHSSIRYTLYAAAFIAFVVLIVVQSIKVELAETVLDVAEKKFGRGDDPFIKGLLTTGDYNLYALAKTLYTEYGIVIFNSGLLLLVAMLGCVRLCMHETSRIVRQDPPDQLGAEPAKVATTVFVYVEHD